MFSTNTNLESRIFQGSRSTLPAAARGEASAPRLTNPAPAPLLPAGSVLMWPVRRFPLHIRFGIVLSCTHKSEGTMALRSILLLLLTCLPIAASDALDRAHKSEESGDSVAARELFVQSLRQTPRDAELLSGYAEFLERYHDPAAAATYRKHRRNRTERRHHHRPPERQPAPATPSAPPCRNRIGIGRSRPSLLAVSRCCFNPRLPHGRRRGV